MSLKKPLRLAGALVLSAFAVVPAAADASTPFQPTPLSCITVSGNGGACTAQANASGMWELELSKDGKFAYGAAYSAGAVHAYSRNPETGALNFLACYQETPVAPCIEGRSLNNVEEIELSPDGESLYVSSWASGGGVAAFDRDPATGLLTQYPGQDGCITDDGTDNAGGAAGLCRDGRGFNQSSGMRLSPDGKHMYVPQFSAGLVVLSVDPAGGLSQPVGAAGCIASTAVDGCAVGRAMGSSRQPAVNPTGSHVYLPTNGPRGVLVLQRNATTGALTQPAGTAGCITVDGTGGECTTQPGIGFNVVAAQMSHDGKQLYLMHSLGVHTFAVSPSGTLSFQSCINDLGSDGCANGRNTRVLGYADVTPDGEHLLVNHTGNFGSPDSGLTVLNRDAAGNLTSPAGQDACVTQNGHVFDEGAVTANGCRSHPAMLGHGHVDVVDDQRFQVSSLQGDGTVTFKRDFYPQCASKTVDVAFNTSKSVDLTCSDRNGEGVALEIVAPPVGGSLGGVDQDNDRVFYNPFAGFSGPDSFTYRGKSGTHTSDAAKVSLNVAGPPTDNDKDGVSPPADCDDNNAAVRPGAADVPGNGIDEDCVGGDLALPPGKIANGVDYFFDARNRRYTKVGRLNVTNLIAGATLQVRCIGGKKKGCKFSRKSRTFSKAAARFNAKRYFNFTKRVKGKKRKIVSKLKKGTRIEIRVTKAGMIGKVITFKTRSGKVPTFVVTCLPVGATKPQKTC